GDRGTGQGEQDRGPEPGLRCRRVIEFQCHPAAQGQRQYQCQCDDASAIKLQTTHCYLRSLGLESCPMDGQTANPGNPAAALTPLEWTCKAPPPVRMVARFGCAPHPLAADGLLAMRAAAATAGIDLHPVSGFRDFWRQLAIWNDKYSGARALL